MAHSETDSGRSHYEAHPWETDKNFGVVHTTDCDICTTTALADKRPSFCEALENRQESLSFSAGIIEGRRLQRARNTDELNEAHEQLTLLRSQLKVAQAECERLKQQLEDVQPGREVGTPVPEFPSDHYLRRSSEVWGTGEETHGSLRDIRDAVSSPSAVSDSPSLMEHANDVPDNPWAETHSTPIDYPNSSPTVPTLYIAPSEASTGQSVRQIEGEESDELAPQECSDAYAGSPAIPVDLQSVERREPAQTRTAKKNKPLNINEAKRLMELARVSGNVGVLGKVKQLLRVAKETTKEERTIGQTHLLAEWRSVEWDVRSYPGPSRKPKPPKGAKAPVADASAEEWAAYYATLSVPVRGLRRSEGKPVLSDVKALRTVARLQPVKSHDNKTPGNKVLFKPAVAQLFSVHGAYENSLRNENISIAPSVTYTPYSGSYDTNDIARHFARCGVTYAVANTELGPWAEEYLKSHSNTSEVRA